MGALTAVAALLTFAPALEGWWRPEGPDPHPSALEEPVRARILAAVVQLGPGESGAFVSRDGLIVTSASAVRSCVSALQKGGVLGSGPFVAPSAEGAPVCPKLKARFRLDARDVGAPVEAALRAGSTRVEASLISACERLDPRRACEVVKTEDGAHRLLVRRVIDRVRLRFWPGEGLAELGGPARAHQLPRLKLDAALLSVDVGRSGAPGHLRLAAQLPDLRDELWVFHHPGPTLRWSTALEAEIFARAVLPVYLARARATPELAPLRRGALERLSAEAEAGLARSRWRDLDVIGRLRALESPRREVLLATFTVDGTPSALDSWRCLASTESGDRTHAPALGGLATGLSLAPISGCAPEATGTARVAPPERRRAYLAAGRSPVGPDGRFDVRVSRGFVVAATAGDGGWRVPWRALVEAADLLGVPLGVERPLPWPLAYAVGFELTVDIGPLATGGPVVDEDGALVGVVSGGDARTLNGLYTFDPAARAAITSIHALETFLARSGKSPELAEALRRR